MTPREKIRKKLGTTFRSFDAWCFWENPPWRFDECISICLVPDWTRANNRRGFEPGSEINEKRETEFVRKTFWKCIIRAYKINSRLNAFKLYFLENEASNFISRPLPYFLVQPPAVVFVVIVYSAVVFNRFQVYLTNVQTRSARKSRRRVRRKASIPYLQFVCSRMITPLSACTTIIAPPCIADSYMYTQCG